MYRAFALSEVAGHVVVCPPQANQSAWLRKIKPRRTAAITGWATDPAAIYRYQCDAAFPLSDHADFADLLRFIELVQPKRVYTVHGYTEQFARTLRDRGIEAWALGVDNQLEISLTELNRGGLCRVPAWARCRRRWSPLPSRGGGRGASTFGAR